MLGLGNSFICEPLYIMLECMKFQFLVWNVESGLGLLDYLVKTRSRFKITTKHIIELWNIECFHFNY
jgi:hypothetical protein